MVRFKAEHITIPQENMMLFDVLYHIILVLGDYILLDGLKLGNDVLYRSGVDNRFSVFRAIGYFILDYVHE